MGEDVVKLNPYLGTIYEHIRNDSLTHLKQGSFKVDPYLDETINDDRRGLTLLLRPPAKIQAQIFERLSPVRKAFPELYCYPASDFHVTVLSIISCYSGFRLEAIDPSVYTSLIEKIPLGPQFAIKLQGLVYSPGAVMIKGYFVPGTLDRIRNQIRATFHGTQLQQSIDSRYVLETAHITVMRFREAVRDQQALVHLLEEYKDVNFGEFRVKTLELVGNDWYQRQEFTAPVAAFTLKDS